MSNNSIVDKIEFAIKYKVPCEVYYKSSYRPWKINIYAFDGNQIQWRNAETENPETENAEADLKLMNLSNIRECNFTGNDDIEFRKYIKCKNNGIDDYKSAKENLENLFHYYGAILEAQINELVSKKTLTKDEETELVSLKNKSKLLETILKKLFESEVDLLFPFVMGSEFNNSIIDAEDRPILLLGKSNASQKSAIEKSLSEKVSFIEGPPGTGKTTTILSIVANLLYRNQKAVVVSKNNSAIDNIGEELDKLDLPKIYVRLGNSSYTTNLFEDVLNDIENYQQEVEKYADVEEPNIVEFNSEYSSIREKEFKLNELVKKKNELAELENQKRHIEKRQAAYNEKFSGRLPFWIGFLKADQLAKIIGKVSKKIEKYSRNINKKISIFDIAIAALFWGIKSNDYFKQYLLLKWQLETIYLTEKMSEVDRYIKENDFNKLKDEINELYAGSYCQKSTDLLKKALYKYYLKSEVKVNRLIKEIKLFKAKYKSELKRNEYDSDFLKEKSRLIQMITDFFPFTLTTADSLPNNFYEYRNGKEKFDYVIMDEATQCDVISGLPVLFYAKHCVISGDSKQLSAITGNNEFDIDDSNIDEKFKYFSNDFLNATKSAFCAEPTLLKEHYRCDYNIINYCNRFFYDNELIIYKSANVDAMELIDVSQGKYSNYDDSSFSNEREIYSINEQCAGDLSDSYVITPFKNQKELLKKQFSGYKDNCGTIHSFQGRGKENVYFSTVLNDLDFCNKHLSSNHNLFTSELVNVAVSRAKDKFILVTDKKYFSERSQLIKNLILYIDKYGKEIPDKTVCLFDYLYKQMPTYVEVKNCSNPFELKVFETLEKFCDEHKGFSVFTKLPLAELVTDGYYLNTHDEIRHFVLNERTHVDFTIVNALENPVLAIELDGQEHDSEIQIQRDIKKNKALEHMNIPLKRINSKSAFSEQDLISMVVSAVCNASATKKYL